MFKKIVAVSKKAQIVGLLREAIISGAIERGEPIVGGKLAQQFGVGQGLIREALIELEQQGLVQRTPFSGTNVCKLTSEDVQNIFEVRMELEPLASYLATKHIREAELRQLSELAEETRVAFESKDLDGFFESHLAFRKKIWAISRNPYLQQALERVVIPLYALYLTRSTYNREGLALCIEFQDKTLQAFRSKDLHEARHSARDFLVRMRQHLGRRLARESEKQML